MSIKIAVANVKGGVGKSTIATNFASISAMKGKKTILIDTDTQGSSMAYREARSDAAAQFQAVAIHTPTVHKDIDAFNAEHVFIDVGGRDTKVFRSAILASDMVLIPLTPSQFDIWSSEDTFTIIEEIKIGHEDLTSTLMLNMVISGTNLSDEVHQILNDFYDKYKYHLFKNHLFHRVGFKESISQGLSVVEIKGDKFKKASDEILTLYEEVMSYATENK
ncbi:MAG: AAA family ATPase [Candidatus Aminicenantes bacterium]|nr:AAA family ATPase [Candidatus Aminicenantes bacterium]